MSKYALEQSHAEFQANRPVSATIETTHRVNQQIRPSSEILAGHYKSPEAEAIDRWFEDLSYYERTLEQMAKAKLDDNFREELKAIEQWFSVLTDPERTTALYSLLQHTTQVQIRFFITVLQQMAQKDPMSMSGVQGLTHAQKANMAGVPPGMHMQMNQKKDGLSGNMGTLGRGTRRVFDRHSAPPTDETYGFQNVPFQGSEPADDFDYKRASGQSNTSNRNSLQPLTPVDPISSANWSVPVTNPAPGHERSSQRSSVKIGNGTVASIVTSPRIGPDQKSANSPYAQNASPRPLSVPSSPILQNMSPSTAAAMLALAQQAQATGLNMNMNPHAVMAAAAAAVGIQHPGSGWGHVDITPSTYTRPTGSPTGYARSDFSDTYDYESADSSTGPNGPHHSGRTRSAPSPGGPHKEKGKIPESIDLEALKDIPGWLRSLRLHKYTPIFETMDWKEMIKLSDEELSARGVAALGARRKMLKVFDMVKKDLDSRGISY